MIFNWISDYFCNKLIITWQATYSLPPIMNSINEYYHHDDPVRQGELAKIKNLLRNSFRNKSVLEAACGTGYWTKTVAQSANNISAVDNSVEMLEIAKAKNTGASNPLVTPLTFPKISS